MHNEEDQLKKFVDAHRDDFDDHTPPSGIWEAIDNELSKDTKRIKTFSWAHYAKRAAAIIIIATVSIVVYELINSTSENSTNNTDIAIVEVPEDKTVLPPEIVEAEQYYSVKIEDKFSELKRYNVVYPELEEDIEIDMAELDSAYSELKKDLSEEMANEEIIEAMIQNYRLKLEILENILEELKDINEDDNESDDPSA